MTRTGQFVGTLDYISPEQIRGDRATAQSDVYALAAVLYECLTGVVPFPKDSEAAVLYAHMADPPPRVSDHRPELPGTLDEVMARAMAKEPGRAVQLGRRADARRSTASFSRRCVPRSRRRDRSRRPQETGIRPAEAEVETREARAPDDAPPTEPGALEAETAPPSGHPETVRSAEPPEPDRHRGSRGVGTRRHTRQRRRPARGARCHGPRRGPVRDGARAVAGRGGAPAG